MTPEPFQQSRQTPRAVMRDDRAVARASRIRNLDLSPPDAYFTTTWFTVGSRWRGLVGCCFKGTYLVDQVLELELDCRILVPGIVSGML
jgi:hypothetical protein